MEALRVVIEGWPCDVGRFNDFRSEGAFSYMLSPTRCPLGGIVQLAIHSMVGWRVSEAMGSEVRRAWQMYANKLVNIA